jgi:hypothetical protein
MIQTPTPTLLRLSLSLAAAAVACTIDIGGPVPPAQPVSSDDSSGQAVDQTWEGALASAAETGRLTVLFDETQLTSLLVNRLADDPDAILESPVVLLREGAIQVYGVVHQEPVRGNILLTITPVLSQDGDLGFELTSAEFGPVPMSEGVRESLSALMTEALSGPLGTLATGVRITSVAIDSGQLALVGELR